jgi:hypothetical protein
MPGVMAGPITAIRLNPPVLEVNGVAFVVAEPALVRGLRPRDRVTVMWEQEGPTRRVMRITRERQLESPETDSPPSPLS